MKIIIIASDIHSGGGKVMLNDILSAAVKMKSINFYVLADSRYDASFYSSENIFITTISKFQRIFYVNSVVKKLSSKNDVIINISDFPTFRRFSGTVIQYIMNRYFIDDYPTVGLAFIVRLRLLIEKIAFSIYLKKADYIFVQNLVMKDLLLKLGYDDNTIEVIPFKNIDLVSVNTKVWENSFLYVASGEVYKNHINLISAWEMLAKENIYPMLFLTIDDNTALYNQITEKINKNNLKIFIKPNLPREELLSYYQKVSALIYPSFFECFGIPLVEASNYNLPVIASELDYVRDLIDPVETFDPSSPRSISRSVKRFIGSKENRKKVITADMFTKKLALYAKK